MGLENQTDVNCAFTGDAWTECMEEDSDFCKTCFYNVDYFLGSLGSQKQEF